MGEQGVAHRVAEGGEGAVGRRVDEYGAAGGKAGAKFGGKG